MSGAIIVMSAIVAVLLVALAFARAAAQRAAAREARAFADSLDAAIKEQIEKRKRLAIDAQSADESKLHSASDAELQREINK